MDKAFKRKFPNLSRELESSDSKIPIEGVRQEIQEHKKAPPDRFRGYDPDVIDFLRRCDTEEEGHEIIDYLIKRGELEKGKASELKKQMEFSGIRCFGPKKVKWNYYK